MKSKRHRAPRPDTMKCVRLVDGRKLRMSNFEAAAFVREGAKYISKTEWRKEVQQ